MSDIFILDETAKPRRYGLSNFVGDVHLTIYTFGLWGVWWVIRELRRR